MEINKQTYGQTKELKERNKLTAYWIVSADNFSVNYHPFYQKIFCDLPVSLTGGCYNIIIAHTSLNEGPDSIVKQIQKNRCPCERKEKDSLPLSYFCDNGQKDATTTSQLYDHHDTIEYPQVPLLWKQLTMEIFKGKYNLKGNSYILTRISPRWIQSQRRELSKRLKATTRESRYYASLTFNKLIVNWELYTIDQLKGKKLSSSS